MLIHITVKNLDNMLLKRLLQTFDAAMLQNDRFQFIYAKHCIVELIGNIVNIPFYNGFHQSQET
ncbi:hypothetical protein D3C81_1962850 [compost metagenome]